MPGEKSPGLCFRARPAARAQEGQLGSAGELTRVSHPADFRFGVLQQCASGGDARGTPARLPQFWRILSAL